MAHFQGRVVPSRAPKDPISRGGLCHQPPLEMRPIFSGAPAAPRKPFLGVADNATRPWKAQ